MQHIHQWLVRQGRIGLMTTDTHVVLDIDPEGAEACVLTVQDAQEVAVLLTTHAQSLWSSFAEPPAWQRTVEQTGSGVFRWALADATISVHTSADAVVLHTTNPGPTRFDVNQAVELVQVLEHIVAR